MEELEKLKRETEDYEDEVKKLLDAVDDLLKTGDLLEENLMRGLK